MKRVFVDTSAWYAFARKDDPAHGRFRAIIEEWQGRLVTSNFILDETLTLLRQRAGHACALSLGGILRDEEVVELVRLNSEDEDDAWSLFQRHRDKSFSFTDCTTFAVMRRLRIPTAVAADRHFRQAGFEVLPALS